MDKSLLDSDGVSMNGYGLCAAQYVVRRGTGYARMYFKPACGLVVLFDVKVHGQGHERHIEYLPQAWVPEQPLKPEFDRAILLAVDQWLAEFTP